MTVESNENKTQYVQEDTRRAVDAFENLDTDAKLGLLYLIYEKMGKSITPAAPTATDPNLAPLLLGNYYDLSEQEQLTIMRQIVNREATEYSRAYGSLRENNQLMVWFAWAQAMGNTVVGMPPNYQASETIQNLLAQVESLSFENQISMLRAIASQMGYTEVQPIPTQAETGKTASL
ncbi:MAG: orange carotenoid protein N-terminal domain-containing protein [Leptolyngbyaceae bacterium]|nr:orange carotenoid protein N-terminal domain-containing protein [Leptolyngbyaceae bacterium]